MQLSADQLKHYREKGWLVVEGVFTREQADAAAARAFEIANKELDPKGNACHVDRSEDGKVLLPRKIDQPLVKDRHVFGKLVVEGAMPSIIEQLTGAPPLWHSDQLFMKPPEHGSPKAYHQDNAYFLMHPDHHVITAWIALDDVDEENGCLRYIDGSHLGPILPCKAVPGREHDLTPDDSLIDYSKESLARVKKGGVVFHHSKALHMSGENRSKRWRRGYATHWVSPEVWCENDLLDKGYYLKPEHFEGLDPDAVAAVTGAVIAGK